MIWPICMLITHNTSNTWCTSQYYHSCSYTITTCSSTIKTSNSLQRLLWGTHSFIHKLCTTSIESKFFVATFSTSTYKCVQMNSSEKESICWRVMTWKNGFGTQLIYKKPLSDVIDNHSRMMPVILLIPSFCFKISSEDTQMAPDKPGRLNLRKVIGSGLLLASKLTEIG